MSCAASPVEVCDEIKKDRDVSETTVIGGQRRQVKIALDPARLKAHGASAFQIIGSPPKGQFHDALGCVFNRQQGISC